MMQDIGVFMSIIQGIINTLFSLSQNLFTVVTFFFSAWIILSVLKAVAYRHGG